MKSPLILIALCIQFACFLRAEEADKPVKFEDLPAAAAKVIKTAVGDGKIKLLVLATDEKPQVYEATYVKNGIQYEIAVTRSGTIETEEIFIDIAAAPAAVQTAIKAEVGKGKLNEVSRVTSKGKVSYEATITTGKAYISITFTEAGKVLERASE